MDPKLSPIKGRNLLAVSIKLAIESCRIIKDSYMNKNVKTMMKSQDDPVTQTDFKIQSMLVRGYRQYFPGLRIIGQEQKQYEGTIQTNYKDLDSSTHFPKNLLYNTDYQPDKSCLWIDPLDNTKGFISGEIEAVTTLIGMTYNSKAELGVIGIPFKKNKDKIYYNPSVLFGCTSGGFVYEYYPNQARWVRCVAGDGKSEWLGKTRLAMSCNRKNIIENAIVQQLQLEKIMAGGSGYKMALVAKKQAQVMAYCSPFTQKWDSCAGEAIIKAMGGQCTTQYGQQNEYDSSKPKQLNEDGIVCTLDRELHGKVVEVCKKFDKSANL